MSDEKIDSPVVAFLTEVVRQHREECPINKVCRALIAGIEDGEVSTGSGPAQVATEQYRTGWDGIFGKKQTVGQA